MRWLASSNNEGHKIGLCTPAPWHNCCGWLGIKNQFSVYLYSPNWVLTWQSPLLGRLSCQSWQGSSSGRTAGRRRCRTATSRCQHSHSSPRPAGAHQTPKKERQTQNVSCCFHSNSHQTPRTKRQTQNLSRCLHSNSYQTNVIVLSTIQLHADSHMPNALGKECGEGGWGKMKIRGLGWESWGGSKSLANLAREPGDQEIKSEKRFQLPPEGSNIFYFWSGSGSLFQRVGASWNDLAPERFMCVLTELRRVVCMVHAVLAEIAKQMALGRKKVLADNVVIIIILRCSFTHTLTYNTILYPIHLEISSKCKDPRK